MQLITFEADELPSKSIDVSLQLPLYRDWRRARQNYPLPDRDGNNRVGYVQEDLLLAMMIDSIDGEKPWEAEDASDDMITKLYPLPIEDKQFLFSSLLEMAFQTNQEAKRANNIAEEVRKGYKQFYTISQDDFPSGSHYITFRRPNTGVMMAANKRWQHTSVNGCDLEEMILAHCLATVDGEEIQEKPRDVVQLFDDWSIKDVQFYKAIFVNAFTINDETEGEEARSLAKKKLSQAKTEKKPAKPKASSKGSTKAAKADSADSKSEAESTSE